MTNPEFFTYINQMWDQHIIPSLMDYIRIPNKSPHFDTEWQTHGYMDQAVELIANWCKQHAPRNMQLEVLRLPGRTPLLYMDIPGNNDETIVLYGHLDKQPEMSGWEAGLHPWEPILKNDRLYGRGGADDGYAAFASLLAINTLQKQNIPHARCIIIIEACEESGSYDLPFYIDLIKDRIGEPSLIICLDSGCGNYNQLWITTSLRGLASGILSIDVLKEGIHSGSGSGVVPSSFRILRQLINRIEDEQTGNILLQALQVDIPTHRITEAEAASTVLGNSFYNDFPRLSNLELESQSIATLVLRRTWQPALSIIGIDGIPNNNNAGNVTLPSLAAKLSMRLAPTCDAEKAATYLKTELEKDPPYGAKINFELKDFASGWNAPTMTPWLLQSANAASNAYFGAPAMYMGEGGSIPFMGMLGKKFPKAQFLITGLLGPQSNAHGPNEFLHIPSGKKLTACVAHVIAEHFKN